MPNRWRGWIVFVLQIVLVVASVGCVWAWLEIPPSDSPLPFVGWLMLAIVLFGSAVASAVVPIVRSSLRKPV